MFWIGSKEQKQQQNLSLKDIFCIESFILWDYVKFIIIMILKKSNIMQLLFLTYF